LHQTPHAVLIVAPATGAKRGQEAINCCSISISLATTTDGKALQNSGEIALDSVANG
jgi:hypothetical protein